MTPSMLSRMREACQLAADTLVLAGKHIAPGMTTDDINTLVHDYTLAHKAWPAPLNYHGFPKSVCTSVNEVGCHGIPGDQRLQDGDIVNVDVTSIVDGFFGDTSATFFIGRPSTEARHVTEVSRRALSLGIAQVRDGARLGD